MEGAVGGVPSSPGLETLSITNPFRSDESTNQCERGNNSFGTNPFQDALTDVVLAKPDKPRDQAPIQNIFY